MRMVDVFKIGDLILYTCDPLDSQSQMVPEVTNLGSPGGLRLSGEKMAEVFTLGLATSRPRNTSLPTTQEKSSLSNTTLEMLKDEMLQTTLPALYLLILIISIPLNGISMWYLCYHAHPRTPTITFAINLAATDLLYSMALPFQVAYHLRGNDWPFGDVLCNVVSVLFYGNMHCSVLTMTSISMERYLGIVHPLRSKKLTTVKSASLTCAFIWVFVLLANSPLLYNKLTFHVKDLGIITCFDVLPKDMFPTTMYFYVYFACQATLFFFLPLIVMGVCYISIISTLLHSPASKLGETKKQTACLIVVLLVVFGVCYLPSSVTQIVHVIYVSKGKSLYIIYKLFLALNSLNCCLDPFVYYFASQEFRQGLQNSFFRCIPNGYAENSTAMSEYSTPLAK
uniref:P2Y purinoceptor 8-like isoform X2 n=1 Tax=Geotrypetes seraphini TaxID=260995 RepID=A0A6P8R676_GEOSA|nr:P2Y purinoceptor 8-like isoform X2 [Geotrypetes seraphini]